MMIKQYTHIGLRVEKSATINPSAVKMKEKCNRANFLITFKEEATKAAPPTLLLDLEPSVVEIENQSGVIPTRY